MRPDLRGRRPLVHDSTATALGLHAASAQAVTEGGVERAGGDRDQRQMLDREQQQQAPGPLGRGARRIGTGDAAALDLAREIGRRALTYRVKSPFCDRIGDCGGPAMRLP